MCLHCLGLYVTKIMYPAQLCQQPGNSKAKESWQIRITELTVSIRILHSQKTGAMTLIPEKRSTLFEQVFLKVTELKNIKFFFLQPQHSDTNTPNILFWWVVFWQQDLNSRIKYFIYEAQRVTVNPQAYNKTVISENNSLLKSLIY